MNSKQNQGSIHFYHSRFYSLSKVEKINSSNKLKNHSHQLSLIKTFRSYLTFHTQVIAYFHYQLFTYSSYSSYEQSFHITFISIFAAVGKFEIPNSSYSIKTYNKPIIKFQIPSSSYSIKTYNKWINKFHIPTNLLIYHMMKKKWNNK
jgi:hypothetical protein